MVQHQMVWRLTLVIGLLLGAWAVSEAATQRRGPQERQGSTSAAAGEPRGIVNERRTALVIGNSTYQESPLKNAVNDANDMAAALRQMGFEVAVLNNARLREMVEATETFSKQLRRSDVGLFYYAGHGLQVAGENYLVPIGARLNRDTDVQFEAFHVGRLLGVMEEASNTLNLIILDACRNNPFGRSFRSAQTGLAVAQAAPGSLIAYATAPGSVASDGDGRNGTYTRNLLQSMRTPGLPVEEMFKQVRISVRQETSQKQTPWESSSLTRSFSFVPGSAPAAQAPGPVNTAPPFPSDQAAAPPLTRPALPEPPANTKTKSQPPQQASLPPATPLRPPPPATGKTFVNSIRMEFILIPPGEFIMGAEGTNGIPAHRVAIHKSVYLGKYEVTQAQWFEIMGNNPSLFKGTETAAKVDPERPVEQVSWNEIQEFIQRLNSKEGHTKYRLPTEAEWEYAARAGGTAPSGKADGLDQWAWWASNAKGTTHPVGRLQPNAWGLHDMFGNVWEWVNDWWSPYTKDTATDPQGPPSGALKVFRGGAWNQPAAACQPAHRLYDAPTFKYPAVGFRLAREP